MSNIIPNRNYRIAVDTLADGRVKAKGHGRKVNQQTFPVGTTHEEAARTVALKIEGERFAEVRNYVTFANKSDWDVFVTVGA